MRTLQTWTRLDANRTDTNTGNPTPLNENDTTTLQSISHGSGQHSMSIVVQPTSICHSIYDDCSSCHSTFVRLSSPSSVSDSVRMPSVAVSRNTSWMSDSYQHVLNGKRSVNRPSCIAYRKQLLAVDGDMDINISTIEPRPGSSSDQYVRSMIDRGDDQRASTSRISPVHSTVHPTTEVQLKYVNDVSDALVFTSTSTMRRNDVQSTPQFQQSACLMMDDVHDSSATQVCSNHSETGDSYYCTVEDAAVEAPALSLTVPVAHADAYQAEPSPTSGRNQTDDFEESSREVVENKHCFRDDSMNKTLYVMRVVEEIVETERTYVRDLGYIIQGYLGHLVSTQVASIPQEDIRCLFGNIEYIRDFNSQFLVKLENCFNNPVEVAKCFVEQTEGFVIYSDYCSNYPRSVEVLTRFMKDSEISAILKRQQMLLKHGLPLGSYLLKPVQRILKYHLLLQNILDNYDPLEYGHDVIQKALNGMVNVAIRINEMKRQHERTVRVQEIQSRLYGWHGDDLTTLGDLILEDKFRLSGARERRQIFLFDKALFIAKKKPDGSLMVKAFVECCNLMLIEIVVKQPLSFQIIPFDSPRVQFTVQANKIEQKRLWCQHIRRLIVSEYSDTTQFLMATAIRYKRKDSTLDRLVRRRRRKLTGILFANPSLDLSLPPDNVYQLSATPYQQSLETDLTPTDGATEHKHSKCNEEQSYFVDESLVDDEIFPWPIPDLLNHGKTLHVAHVDDDVRSRDSPRDNNFESEAFNSASYSPGSSLSITSGDTSTAASKIADDVDNSSLTLDPKTLCLERPSTLRRRDSIALRKSKLRQAGGALLQRHCSVRSLGQVHGQSLRYPVINEKKLTLPKIETKQPRNYSA